MQTRSQFPVHHVLNRENYRAQKVDLEDGTSVHKMVREFAVMTVDKVNAEILSQIRDIAKKRGVTDVLVLDEEFIVTALKNEVERRNKITLDEISEVK